MKRTGLPFGRSLALAAWLSCGGCAIVFGPDARPASVVAAPRTEAAIARGRYLAEHVARCAGCHSPSQWTVLSAPAEVNRMFSGGDCLTKETGFPGTLCPTNLTENRDDGVGAWTDGEIARAIREGVSRDGHPLFPVMPYPYLRALSDRDANAIVAYLRTVAAQPNRTRERSLDFPLGLIVKTIPSSLVGPVRDPDPLDRIGYGRYLATIATCMECHTPKSGHSLDGDRLYAGGREIRIPGRLHVVTPNITPDLETGIGKWTIEAFVQRFKAYDVPREQLPEVPAERQTAMPWSAFAGMTPDDLGAIFAYLRTVKPVANHIASTTPDAPPAPPVDGR